MITLDFSTHRLNNEGDLLAYLPKMGNKQFWNYANKVFRQVVLMKPGESFVADNLVKDKNRDLFIKLLCWFVISGLAPECVFNETFTVFTRRNMKDFEPQIINNKRKNNGNK